ncbi:MAG TPA: hypothetical protein VGH33_00045, partial [Isosphaeraceae bacterium]
MGVALFIVPEREVEGLDTFVDGKALAHVKDLDGLAREAGVRPLMEFFSAGPDDLLGILGEEGDDGEMHLPAGIEPPEVAWFDARDGLVTIRGLLRHLADHSEKDVLPGLTREGVGADRLVED